MEMRRGGGAGEAGIGHLPAELLGGGVVIDVGGADASAGVRRHFGLAVERRLQLLGEGGAGEGNRGAQRQRGKQGLVRHGSLPFDVKDGFTVQTAAWRIYSQNDR